MTVRSQRSGFTLLNLLVGVTCCAFLFALALPVIERSREAARRNLCSTNFKELGLALHNYHAVKQRLPVATTTNVVTAIPGSAESGSTEAGYSWIVKILPYLNQPGLYNQIAGASANFMLPAFSPEITDSGDMMSPKEPHLSQMDLPFLRCPSYTGPRYSSASQYRGFALRNAVGEKTGGPATCNVVAVPASHLLCLTATQKDEFAEPPNGVLIPPLPGTSTGLNLRAITDGLSKTIMATETIEPRYSAWYDGTVSYVVGADPNTARIQRARLQPARGEPDGTERWGIWSVEQGKTTLNLGSSSQSSLAYRGAANFSSGEGQVWSWGPSSQHSDGIVVHLFADGAVRDIRDDIDPTLYIHLITRSGDAVVVCGCGG